ncbi:zeta toxin family protein [Microbacterium sp. KHB019]|uniref:zeta toxin family protein n=1 Tax=Microbacterium sp. KHB019 TaxID=3129770 RepID=UPI0030791CB2
MSSTPSSWRTSDAVAYRVARGRASDAIASLTGNANASEATAEASDLLDLLWNVDGASRSAIDELSVQIAQHRNASIEADSRSSPSDEHEVLDERVLPSLFFRSVPQTEPALVLLAGQHGATAGRTIQTVQQQHADRLAPLTSDVIAAFQPASRHVRQSSDADHTDVPATADWLQAAIVHAREHRFSALLEGPFLAPETALGVAHRFADAGYRVRLVTVGVRPDESLLATTSHYLQQLRSGRPGRFITTDAHGRSVMALSELVDAAELDASIRRVSVVDRHGAWSFDTEHGDSGALTGLHTAQAERMSSLESVQWLSELRRITEYVRTFRTMPPPITESLVELHEMALRGVLPELPVPVGSEVVRLQQERLTAELASLRAGLTRAEREDLAAPTFTPSGPSSDGLGR